ncbi:MAG TPA: hypothetical protein VMV27_14020 [Candidatus Binataceae bacterium]|nr:hypothetical protein [Candidatus Binataceae bacterium]
MIDGRIARGPIAAFARIARQVGAGARASAQLAPVAAAGPGSSALARALGAHAAPLRVARAASAAASGAGLYSGDRPQSGARNPGARESAAIAAAVRITMRGAHAARAGDPRVGPSQAPSRPSLARAAVAPRAAVASALGARRVAAARLGSARRLESQTRLVFRAASAVPTALVPARAEAAGAPPRSQRLGFTATLAAASAARRSLVAGWAADSGAGMARGADGGDRAQRGGRAAAPAIMTLPAAIRRVFAGSPIVASERPQSPPRAGAGRAPARIAGGTRRASEIRAPITINSSPSITVNLPPGAAAPGQSEISRAVADALEEHAERLYELMRRFGAIRERAEF